MKKNRLIKLILVFIVGICLYFYDYYTNSDEVSEDNSSDVQKKVIGDNVSSSTDNLEIYFMDVGQADSILIRYLDKNVLIDAGNNEDGEKLVKYFRELGIQEFQYVVVTHPHEDHIGGMDDIIKAFSIEHFYMPDVITTTKTFEDVVDSLLDNNVTLETPKIDSSFKVADLDFKVIYVGDDSADLNNTSIVLKLTYKNTSYLFTGDATSNVEKKILDKDIKSDVLKVGHHGSQYSSTAQFLKAVNPAYAVIQCGVGNSYGHPREVTLNKLEKIGTKIYRTDINHTIKLVSDGENISFDTFETDTNGG